MTLTPFDHESSEANLGALEVGEKLKDMAFELDGIMEGQGCVSMSAVMRRGDRWTTITVRHASPMSESRDGWDVTVEHGEL